MPWLTQLQRIFGAQVVISCTTIDEGRAGVGFSGTASMTALLEIYLLMSATYMRNAYDHTSAVGLASAVRMWARSCTSH